MPQRNIFLIDNGYVVELNQDDVPIVGRVPAGSVFVDGLSVGEMGRWSIRDRQLLARDGVLLVVVTVDKQTGELMAGPDIVTRASSTPPKQARSSRRPKTR